MRSDQVKRSDQGAPSFPFLRQWVIPIGTGTAPNRIANSFNEIIPGHIHLRTITEAVKAGVRLAGGTAEFGAIGICDGIAMGQGVKKFAGQPRVDCRLQLKRWSMPTLSMVSSLIPNCDKIVPGMLMAAARLDLPAIVVAADRCSPVKLTTNAQILKLCL